MPLLLPGARTAGAIGGVRGKSGSFLATGGRWLLTLAALLLAAIAAATAYYMLVPINFDGRGILGFIGLTFPLHLLGLTIVVAVVGLLAWRFGAVVRAAGVWVVAVFAPVIAALPGPPGL